MTDHIRGTKDERRARRRSFEEKQRAYRDEKTCRRCGESATVVHHKSYAYDVMLGYRDEALVSLCGPCHRFIEFDNGRKTTLDKANARLALPPR